MGLCLDTIGGAAAVVVAVVVLVCEKLFLGDV